MIRGTVLKKYINTETIKYMIGHDFSVFLPILARNFIILVALSILFIALKDYIPPDTLYLIFLGAGVILFLKFLVDFFDLYLDTIAVSEHEITLFLWEGFFDNSIEIFDRDRIETISYRQKGFWDRIFMKGDLLIRLDDQIEFPFENIHRPKKIVEKLSFYKNSFIAKKLHEQEHHHEEFEQDERFSILIDALSEVVKDYAQKKA